MAVDVYTDNFMDILSPRISFSHDLEESNDLTNKRNHQIPCRLDHTLLDTNPFDFAFNIDSASFLPSSTADELFYNGRILPTGVKKEDEETRTGKAAPCLDPPATEPQKKSLKEFLEDNTDEEEEEEEEEEADSNTSAKPFWKFRRSNSLNIDKKNKLIGSWKILSRSGSTGKFLGKIVEEDEPEKTVSIKTFWKFGITGNGNANKGLNSNQFRRSSSLNCTISGANEGLNGCVNHLSRSKSTGSAPNHKNGKSSHKGQIKNIKIQNGNGNGNGKYSSIKVTPVLNLPSPYISRVSVDLFGFGSLFCNGSGKDRKKKKIM